MFLFLKSLSLSFLLLSHVILLLDLSCTPYPPWATSHYSSSLLAYSHMSYFCSSFLLTVFSISSSFIFFLPSFQSLFLFHILLIFSLSLLLSSHLPSYLLSWHEGLIPHSAPKLHYTKIHSSEHMDRKNSCGIYIVLQTTPCTI